MQLFLSRLHFPVTTLGPGRRVGIWFQGCSLHCPGCVSQDTWAHGVGETTIDAVLETITPWLTEAEGVTISGGEPMQQPEALESLLYGIRSRTQPNCDVLLYSGYPWQRISKQIAAWQGLVDVVISEPFLMHSPQTLAWRGSDNQEMHLLTPLAELRYRTWIDAPRTALPKALDVVFENGTVWMAGIPDAGTMDMVEAELERAGFVSKHSQSAILT